MTLNIATSKGRKKFEAVLGKLTDEFTEFLKTVSVINWVTTGKAAYSWNGVPLLAMTEDEDVPEDQSVFVRDKIIYPLDACTVITLAGATTRRAVSGEVRKKKSYQACAVVLPDDTKRLPANKKLAKMLIVCGDDGEGVLVGELARFQFPTISFQCLVRLFNGQLSLQQICRLLAKGDLRVADYLPDTYKPMDRKNRTAINAARPVAAPMGFTAVRMSKTGLQWHRSATVLLRDVRGKRSFLVGSDGDNYFGCELNGNPKTVHAAMNALAPPEARNKPHQRQGEWFAVPVDKKKVPKKYECLCTCSDSLELPVDNDDSNIHLLWGESRVGPDGRIYAIGTFTLEHNDHQPIRGARTLCYALYRNTAVRSVSVEGVD